MGTDFGSHAARRPLGPTGHARRRRALARPSTRPGIPPLTCEPGDARTDFRPGGRGSVPACAHSLTVCKATCQACCVASPASGRGPVRGAVPHTEGAGRQFRAGLLATRVLRSAGHGQWGRPSQHCLVSGQDMSLRVGSGAAEATGRGGSRGELGRHGAAVSGIWAGATLSALAPPGGSGLRPAQLLLGSPLRTQTLRKEPLSSKLCARPGGRMGARRSGWGGLRVAGRAGRLAPHSS